MSNGKTMQEKLDNEKSLNEFRENISDIIDDLTNNPENIENLNEDEITEIRKHINPYGRTIESDDKSYTCLSYTNMTKEYYTKLITTTMIGFVFRMCDEYEVLDEELSTEVLDEDFMDEVPNLDYKDDQLIKNKQNTAYAKHKYNYINNNNLVPTYEVDGVATQYKTTSDIFKYVNLSEDDEFKIQQSTNEEMAEFFKPVYSLNKIRKTEHIDSLVQEQSKEEQVVIKRFLNKLFEYNPDLHTKSVYHENTKDPERNPLKPVSRDEKDKTSEMTIEQVLHTKIPPSDTFLRFNYYYDVNYENMQGVVRDLYDAKPDIDIMINVFDKFTDLESAEHFVKKHKNEVITDVLTLTNNCWNIIGPYKENRERINFYNDNTAILESIFKQQETDSKMGAELMKSRVKKSKVRNTRYMGKDDPKFSEYLKNNPNSLDKMGCSRVNKDGKEEVEITEEYEVSSSGAKIDSDGIPEDSVKIGVVSINARTGSVQTTDIYTKADETASGSMLSKS
jgi:hypothetical protein